MSHIKNDRTRERSVVAQVADLERLSMDELRTKWEALYDTPPPGSANRKQLIARLAYRIQELIYGGLSRETKDALERIGAADCGDGAAAPAIRDPHLPVPGTRLIREWQNRRIEVTVLDKGFEYAGRTYRSLTAIATAITGTKWNGQMFFGLRSKSKEVVQ